MGPFQKKNMSKFMLAFWFVPWHGTVDQLTTIWAYDQFTGTRCLNGLPAARHMFFL